MKKSSNSTIPEGIQTLGACGVVVHKQVVNYTSRCSKRTDKQKNKQLQTENKPPLKLNSFIFGEYRHPIGVTEINAVRFLKSWSSKTLDKFVF